MAIFTPVALPSRSTRPALSGRNRLSAFRRAGSLCLLVFAALSPIAATAATAGASPPPGVLVPRFVCSEDPDQSYALYLPPNYDAARAWPILYCFDPAALGPRAAERFLAGARAHGWIVAASNNSRNGPWDDIARAVDALLRDTRERLHLDSRRVYAAGFSGGARVASWLAERESFAGVIACGAGFQGGVTPSRVDFAFFGAAGLTDFNHNELQRLAPELEERKAVYRLAVFPGGHEWLPETMAGAAIDWLELHAMRSGLRPKDDAFIARQFAQRSQSVAATKDRGEAYEGYVELAADFSGLIDVSEPLRQAAALKNTRAVRRHLADREKALRQEDAWLAELRTTAARAAEDPATRRATRAPRRSPPSARLSRPDETMSGDAPVGPSRDWLAGDRPEEIDEDPTRSLRNLVDDLSRKSARHPGARRAINRLFHSYSEHGATLLETGEVASAVRHLEIPVLVDPESPYAQFALARAYSEYGDKSGARKHLDLAVALGFDDPGRVAQLRESLAR